ncbi:MAG: thioredoxin domain-containing protein [Candidatus Eisenbacteria bacterium]
MPVVLRLRATWCGPCKKLEPIIEELGQKKNGSMLVAKVDVGEAPAIAQKFGVMSVPTVIFLKNGQPVHQFTGVASKDKISQLLSQHLGV